MMIWWTAGAVLASALAFFNSHWMNFIGVAGAGFFILGAQGILNNLLRIALRPRCAQQQ